MIYLHLCILSFLKSLEESITQVKHHLAHLIDYAVDYYKDLKAKYAEDMGELKLREFFMREYKSMVEKFSNARTSGPHRMMTGSHSIR